MINCNVLFVKFPSPKVHEVVTENEDGSITVFLDKNATQESNKKRFLHVMKHLEGNDFEKEDVQSIESEAHFGGFQ